jgi:hypothetical protein
LTAPLRKNTVVRKSKEVKRLPRNAKAHTGCHVDDDDDDVSIISEL